jgi:pimeloyl-ACP methyl ester carboxylesterase
MSTPTIGNRRRTIHRWIRRGFFVWAATSTLWVANSVRTRGVTPDLLASGAAAVVTSDAETLSFLPRHSSGLSGLVFICGSGVTAEAYAPLLRPIADVGHAVVIVRLPYRFAPLDAHRLEAIARVRRAMRVHAEVARWVVAGHSLGGAIAAQMAAIDASAMSALVLVGTTHPRDHDLSRLSVPVTKVFGTRDGVAPVDVMRANARMLPSHTEWVAIDGGNHSQFGHYGHQLFDGTATIGREEQQARTRAVLVEALSK